MFLGGSLITHRYASFFCSLDIENILLGNSLDNTPEHNCEKNCKIYFQKFVFVRLWLVFEVVRAVFRIILSSSKWCHRHKCGRPSSFPATNPGWEKEKNRFNPKNSLSSNENRGKKLISTISWLSDLWHSISKKYDTHEQRWHSWEEIPGQSRCLRLCRFQRARKKRFPPCNGTSPRRKSRLGWRFSLSLSLFWLIWIRSYWTL